MCVDGQQLITKHLYSKVVLMSDSGAAIPAIGSYEVPSTNILERRGLLERLKVEGRHDSGGGGFCQWEKTELEEWNRTHARVRRGTHNDNAGILSGPGGMKESGIKTRF
ncbi:hypothetical protein CEXT_382941 [Caerostris extrusa]|uniref:Uncharacterized protein n=1 Tax=Caerostris extrusa TaxID=172846 RepID=A0AAV4W0J7_CAEEX|nr:hypothetical protein CEXT_382941 [Caerostris extrusa]